MVHHENPKVVETATDARQGRRGLPVLRVLIGGLVLVLIGWAAAEFWGNAIEPASQQGSGEAAVSTGQPGTAQPGGTVAAPVDRTPHSQSGTGGAVPTNNNTGNTNQQP